MVQKLVFVQIKFWSERNLLSKDIFGPKYFVVQSNLGSTIFWVQNMLRPKYKCVEKIKKYEDPEKFIGNIKWVQKYVIFWSILTRIEV